MGLFDFLIPWRRKAVVICDLPLDGQRLAQLLRSGGFKVHRMTLAKGDLEEIKTLSPDVAVVQIATLSSDDLGPGLRIVSGLRGRLPGLRIVVMSYTGSPGKHTAPIVAAGADAVVHHNDDNLLLPVALGHSLPAYEESCVTRKARPVS
jgi:ActR/RegA family two-component response regulator